MTTEQIGHHLKMGGWGVGRGLGQLVEKCRNAETSVYNVSECHPLWRNEEEVRWCR